MARENFRKEASAGVCSMRRLLTRFFEDESGATALEYCIIAAGLSIVIVGGVNGIGSALKTTFTSVANSLK